MRTSPLTAPLFPLESGRTSTWYCMQRAGAVSSQCRRGRRMQQCDIVWLKKRYSGVMTMFFFKTSDQYERQKQERVRFFALAFAQDDTRARAKRETSHSEWPTHWNKASSSNIRREGVSLCGAPIDLRMRSSRGRRVPFDEERSGN